MLFDIGGRATMITEDTWKRIGEAEYSEDRVLRRIVHPWSGSNKKGTTLINV